jgi:polyhydroxyalkanoate synthesis repressor PhaR
MNESRVIKKYPNRRLYDTTVSSYITLNDVRRLVMDQVPFSVQDAKTGEDLTRAILLQIILEQEEQGDPIFSSSALKQIIRMYGSTMQNLLGAYLENSFRLFLQQQQQAGSQMQQILENTPLSYMAQLADQNFKLWREMQENFLRSSVGGANKAEEAEKK